MIYFHGIDVSSLSESLNETHDNAFQVIQSLADEPGDLDSKYHSCFQLYHTLHSIVSLCNVVEELIDHYGQEVNDK